VKEARWFRDRAARRLFCACDSGRLIVLDSRSGRPMHEVPLSGAPDVVFFNLARRQLYVAVGDPGVIDVFDTATMARVGTVATGPGAHTLAFDPARDRVYAFLPATHCAAVYKVR